MNSLPRKTMVLMLAALLVLCGAMAEPNKPREARDGTPLMTLAGASSHIEEPLCVRITSADEFQAVYMRHLGEDPARFDDFYNPHGVPLIDFDRCMVLGVFQGTTWNTAGVYVHSTVDDDDLLIVRIENRTFQTAGPAPDGGRRQVSPYGIFVLPRSDRGLVVEQDVRRLKAAPRDWQEMARFDAVAREAR